MSTCGGHCSYDRSAIEAAPGTAKSTLPTLRPFARMLTSNVAATPLRVQRKSAQRAASRSAVARPCVASAAAAGDVPDMGKRNTMNLLLLGAIGLPGLPLAGGFAYFFVPPRCGVARAVLISAAGQRRDNRRARERLRWSCAGAVLRFHSGKCRAGTLCERAYQ